MRRDDTGLRALARAVEVRPALNVASCQYKVSQNSVLGHQVMGEHPRVTCCDGEEHAMGVQPSLIQGCSARASAKLDQNQMIIVTIN
jgi:hypothetical protein